MAKHQKNEKEYDWLNDPFDEKKAEEDELASKKMSSKSKIVLGVGCLAVLVILVAFAAVSCAGIATLISPEMTI